MCRCDSIVDEKVTYDLSCKFNSGRLSRNFSVNFIIKSALATAEIPSDLETQMEAFRLN